LHKAFSSSTTLDGYVITYIGVGVGDVSQRLTHEAKAGEVTLLALDLLILLWAGGVITGEVEVTQGSTRSRHDLLKLLVLLVPKALLLLVVALVARVIPVVVVVVVLVGEVELLPFGAVDNEVGGVAALEATPRWSPHLLVKLVQGSDLPRQQGDHVIRDALILLIRSCYQKGQGKLQSRWDSGVGGVSIMATNTKTSNQSFTRERSIMIWMTFTGQFMRFKLAK
jgi:hypothetical protein